MPKSTPPQDLLLSLLDYDPNTGFLTWKPRAEEKTNPPQTFNARFAGNRAGNIYGKHGCRQVSVAGARYLAHRIIWAMITGKTDFDEIDHINGDPDDNRLANLREVSHLENMMNRRIPKHNSSGVLGVCWHRQCKKWRAYVTNGGKQTSLGLFDSIADAAEARANASTLMGYHENHGR